MDDYFEIYYKKKFFRNNMKPKRKELKNIYIFNNINLKHDIYGPYQQYLFPSNSDYYGNIYNNYKYNQTTFSNDDYNYYINDNGHNIINKAYSLTSKSANNMNILYGNNTFKVKNIYKNSNYNNNIFNYKNKNNSNYNYSNFNNRYNNIYNSFNNVSAYNNYIARACKQRKVNIDTFNDFNNKINSRYYIPNNTNNFNSKSLVNFDVKNNSVKIYHLNNLRDDSKQYFCKSTVYEKNNNKIYLSEPNIKSNEKIEPKNKKIIKINIIKGKTYISQQNNNEFGKKILYNNYHQNNFTKCENLHNYNKKIKKEKKQIKKIQLNINSNENSFNDEKQLIINRNNILKDNNRLLSKITIISNLPSQENSNRNSICFISKDENINTNIDTNDKEKLHNENNHNQQNNRDKTIKISKNIKTIDKIQIKKMISKLPKITRIQIQKKDLNLSIKYNMPVDKQKPIKKEFKTKPPSPISKNINNFNEKKSKNIKEKKVKKSSNIPYSNNVLVISSNTSRNKKIIQTNENKVKLQSKYNHSFLTNKTKKDSSNKLSNQFNTKKVCELCKTLVNSFLYKIHYMSHPSQILKYLFLGNFVHATNLKELSKLKINYILNCAIECYNYNLPKNIEELHLNIKDAENFDIINYFEIANEFINKCKLMGGVCLVHCKLGISRSATFVIAYLIKYQKLKVDEAFEFVKKKRISIRPNDGFMKQLYEYEKILRKRTYS